MDNIFALKSEDFRCCRSAGERRRQEIRMMFWRPQAGQQDDGFPTISSRQQQETEEIVGMCVPVLPDGSGPADTTEMPDMRLHKEKHVKFCLEGLESLGQGYSCLDASRPWLTYWTIHSLAILDALPSDEICSRVVNFLGKCQSPKGGFCGGPGQAPHLAPTYAAVNALATVGTPEAFAVIDRASLHSFLLSMKDPCGGFRMHEGGEIDVRGSYCALNSAFIAGVMTEELKSGCAEFIRDCMTYEGGMGGEPFNEAHGGYAFCGYAAMVLLGCEKMINRDRLLRWAVGRQMNMEGGFQGRNNKLVDGCYSFWMGGLIPLLSGGLAGTTVVPVSPEGEGRGFAPSMEPLFDQEALQLYILSACQEKIGGLRDKPSKRRDYYHTCYCLSGLSVAQHSACPSGGDAKPVVLGPPQNQVVPVDAVLNIVRNKARAAAERSKTLPPL